MANLMAKKNIIKAKPQNCSNSNKLANAEPSIKHQLEIKHDIYRDIIQNALEGFILGDSNSNILDVNDSLCRMTGFNIDELFSLTIQGLMPGLDKKAQPGGIYETQIKCNDGHIIDVQVDLIQINKQPEYFAYFLEDITQQKKTFNMLVESEGRYHTLFDNVPVVITETDFSKTKQYIDNLRSRGVVDFRMYFDQHPDELDYCSSINSLIAINEYAGNLYKDYDQDELTDIDTWMKKLTTYQLPYNAKNYKEFLLACIDEKNTSGYEYSFINIKGERSYYIIHKHIVPGYEDSWAKVITITTDITELKQNEIQLQKYKDHLEELVKDRTRQVLDTQKELKKSLAAERKLARELQEKIKERIDFTSALVHELKTPLTPLVVGSEALLTTINQEPQRSFARDIHISVNRLSRKVDDLLDLSRGEAGILKLSYRWINPEKTIREALNIVNMNPKSKEYRFIIDIPKKLYNIKADKERLIQVLCNLFDNAMKYTPVSGTISVKAEEIDSWLKIEISDTGIGISEENKKYLFQPYKRFSNTRNRIGGLGLGLVISKYIVELHGGNISVSSCKGTGSTFTIKIPVT